MSPLQVDADEIVSSEIKLYDLLELFKTIVILQTHKCVSEEREKKYQQMLRNKDASCAERTATYTRAYLF